MRPASLLVDGHAHLHGCFDRKAFLEAAAVNFASARVAHDLPAASPGCLMFTDPSGADSVRALASDASPARALGWQVDHDDEGCLALRRGEERLLMVGGRQIVTAEGLEVLALAGAPPVPDGRPTADVLRAVVAAGAVAVVPWGFGKWTGRRGRILRRLIDGERDFPFCLGDNGGRPRGFPRPALFDVAERHGRIVLGGTDPLPLPWHATRPGSYGFVLDDWRSDPRPAAAIVARLGALDRSPATFGALSSPAAACRSQLQLRWRRYRSRAGGTRPALA